MIQKTPIKFAIAALAAAGISAPAFSGDKVDKPSNGNGVFDDVKSIIKNLEAKQTYTLAQHRSHQSHGSHQSHSSHRSSSYAPPVEKDDNYAALNTGIQLAVARNDRSTPANSILPSSPAIVGKLKPLPGNSGKFKDVVQKMKLALVARGYEITQINGDIDARTRAAIFRFQSVSGMRPNGKVTPDVLEALNISTE